MEENIAHSYGILGLNNKALLAEHWRCYDNGSQLFANIV